MRYLRALTESEPRVAIAHELRTPLCLLILQTDLVAVELEREETSESMVNAVQCVRTGLERLSHLVEILIESQWPHAAEPTRQYEERPPTRPERS